MGNTSPGWDGIGKNRQIMFGFNHAEPSGGFEKVMLSRPFRRGLEQGDGHAAASGCRWRGSTDREAPPRTPCSRSKEGAGMGPERDGGHQEHPLGFDARVRRPDGRRPPGSPRAEIVGSVDLGIHRPGRKSPSSGGSWSHEIVEVPSGADPQRHAPILRPPGLFKIGGTWTVPPSRRMTPHEIHLHPPQRARHLAQVSPVPAGRWEPEFRGGEFPASRAAI